MRLSLLEAPWMYQHFLPKVKTKMAASSSPSCMAKKKRPCPASYIARIESCRYSCDLRMAKPFRSAVPSSNP